MENYVKTKTKTMLKLKWLSIFIDHLIQKNDSCKTLGSA